MDSRDCLQAGPQSVDGRLYAEGMTAMRCLCGGEMTRRHVERLSRWGQGTPYVLVTDVPAYVCQRCGEVELDHDVAAEVQRLVRAGVNGAVRTESLPVKTFAGRAGVAQHP